MSALGNLQQVILQELDYSPETQGPSAKMLRELFVDLWTRCSEASFRAALVAGRASIQTDRNTVQTLRNIEEICSVDAIYRRMHTALNEMQAAENREIDRLRKRCALLTGENIQLRAQAGVA